MRGTLLIGFNKPKKNKATLKNDNVSLPAVQLQKCKLGKKNNKGNNLYPMNTLLRGTVS